MLSSDYLTLRLFRLKTVEDWSQKREDLSFLFPKAGVGQCVIGPATQPIAAGEVLVFNGSGQAVKLRPQSAQEMLLWGFSLKFEHLFPLFEASEIPLLNNVCEGLKSPRFYPASSPVSQECHRLVAEVPPQFNLDHRGQLLRVAATVLNEELKNASRQRTGFVRIEDHLMQVFEKLGADELLTLSVGELAAKFGCSRRHLNRLFHQHFGFSVAALRMEMRLLKAISLLRDPHAKVISVAERCGFNHLGLFNTCFKKRFGASPGQWRKLLAHPEGAQSPVAQTPTADCPLRANGLCPWTGKSENCPPTIVSSTQSARPRPARGERNTTAPANVPPSTLGSGTIARGAAGRIFNEPR